MFKTKILLKYLLGINTYFNDSVFNLYTPI